MPVDSRHIAKSSPYSLGIAAFFLTLVWGLAFTAIDIIVRYMSPAWLVVIRTLIGALLITAWTYARKAPLPPLTDKRWVWYAMLGLFGIVVPFNLIGAAQQEVESGLSSVLVGTMPLMTIILAHFFANETLTVRKLFGFCLGFLGTALLFLPNGLSLELITNWPAQLMLLCAAFCYALTTILAKHSPDTAHSAGSAMMLITGGIISIGFALIDGPILLGSAAPISRQTWLLLSGLIALLSLGSTALGTVLYLWVIDVAGPSVLAKINYFPPIISVAAGIVFLGEGVSLNIALALALVIIGIIIARRD